MVSLKKYIPLLFILLFFSCKKKSSNITPAFYHWQTEFQLENSEKTYLQNFPIKKIYVKFFDVDWHSSGEPLPQAEVIWNEKIQEDIEIIPTIFITNRSLKNYPLEKMEGLGENILDKIFELLPTEKQDISEIQIDCDWSGTTKEKYFHLLSFLRKNISKKKIKLSATIRLHQIKFFKQTGIPPVDKGMLMFYNVGEVTNMETKNSILDLAIAKQYLGNFEKYPLQLDLALPIFSWGVLFRDGKMIKLMSGLEVTQLLDQERFIKTADNFFQIKKSTYLDGRYLYEGDEIRLESVSLEGLQETAHLLKNHLSNNDLTISFYHLDTATIKHFQYEKLKDICDIFLQ